jgi:flagellar hook assembly protein FlgD
MVRRATVGQNYPNPFNPSTSIEFTVPREMEARLELYDVRGRRVRNLYSGRVTAGLTTIEWDGLDDRGMAVASGVYTYALITEDGTSARRMTLLK